MRNSVTFAVLPVLTAAAVIALAPASASEQSTQGTPSTAGEFYAGLLFGQQNYDGEIWNGALFENQTNGKLNSAGVIVGWRDNNANFFYGIEADFSVPFDGTVTNNGAGCGTAASIVWCGFEADGHVRAIAGLQFDQFDVFAGVGVAATKLVYSNLAFGDFESSVLTGYTLGLGVDVRVNENWKLRVEGLHDNFNDATFSDGYNGQWSQNTVRAAAIFKF